MFRHLRWTALLAVVALVLAACNGGETTAPSTAASQPAASAAESTAEDPTAVCEADEFGCVEIAEGDPITIGTALAITGDVATLGLDSQYGAEVAAQFKEDEGGVLGRDIEFIHEDAGCGDAATGQTAAQALVAESDSLVAVIGTSCSRTAVPAAPVLAQEGIVLISSSNTSPTLTDPEHDEWAGEFFLRTAHNDLVQGAAMAQYACEQGYETAATIHDGSTYADNLQQVFAEAFPEECGGTITAQEAVAVGDTEFTTVLTTIAADSPDLLWMPIFHPEGTLIAQAAQDFPGLEDTQLGSADGMLGSPDVIEQGGDAVDGMIFSGPACAGDEYENTFLPAYTEVSNEPVPVSVFHCHAYDAANMIFDAIEAVGIEGDDGTLYIPRQAFRDAIYATSGFEGLTGNLTCDENGDCADPAIRVSTIQDDAYVVTWP
jgi:branched-chain amino acid transport system substrate-binding protein